MIACVFFFLMIRRPPRSTLDRSSAASDVYKRQVPAKGTELHLVVETRDRDHIDAVVTELRHAGYAVIMKLSLIHISEPTRPY